MSKSSSLSALASTAAALILSFIDFSLRWMNNPATVDRFGSALGTLGYYLMSGRRKMALENLEFIYGDKLTPADRKQIVLGMFRSFGSVFVEILWDNDRHTVPLQDWVELEGLEHLQAALEEDKGILLSIAHFGNWALLVRRLDELGHRVTCLMRPAEFGPIRSKIEALAQRLDIDFIATPLSRRDIERCLNILANNGILMIAGDRRANDQLVDFLGKPAWTPQGIATMHLRSGAPILPAYVVRTRTGHHRITIEPAIHAFKNNDRKQETLRLIKALNTRYAEWINQHPDHWLWIHNRWRERKRPSKRDRREKQ